jgi:hypothetical protein
LAENHACFSGCYAPGHDSLCLVNGGAAPEPALDVQCEDCLSFRLGALVSQLALGMNRYRLAKELSAHLCAHRGYAFAFGGYHTQGGGFWLSAAYLASIGVFILKSDRGITNTNSSDSDLLVKAFTTGVAKPPHIGMLDPGKYTCHRVFLDVVGLSPPVSAQALLGSRHVSSNPSPGFVEVTLAEYLPVSCPGYTPSAPLRASAVALAPALARASGPIGPSPSAPLPAPAPRASVVRTPPKPGDLCEVCGEVAVERALLTSVYVACGCG